MDVNDLDLHTCRSHESDFTTKAKLLEMIRTQGHNNKLTKDKTKPEQQAADKDQILRETIEEIHLE